MWFLSDIYKKHAIFVHPAKFLVSGPNRSTIDLQMFGEPTQRAAALLILKEEINGPRDQNRVCYFDLPIAKTGSDSE